MGHSTSSGRGGGGTAARAEAAYNELSARVEAGINSGIRAISRATFKAEGNGQWTLDVPGQGGGQILDETGSSRDPAIGYGGKLYSARAWDENYQMTEANERYFYSLNEAKSYVKEQLQNRRRNREILGG